MISQNVQLTRRNILTHQFLTSIIYVKFEGITAVTVKNAVFWDINPSSYLTGDTLSPL
jgi:hypothetical protein